MRPIMTRSETMKALDHPCWNKSYFARKLYGDEQKNVCSFHSKLKWGSFSIAEINRINLIFKEIINSEI